MLFIGALNGLRVFFPAVYFDGIFQSCSWQGKRENSKSFDFLLNIWSWDNEIWLSSSMPLIASSEVLHMILVLLCIGSVQLLKKLCCADLDRLKSRAKFQAYIYVSFRARHTIWASVLFLIEELYASMLLLFDTIWSAAASSWNNMLTKEMYWNIWVMDIIWWKRKLPFTSQWNCYHLAYAGYSWLS